MSHLRFLGYKVNDIGFKLSAETKGRTDFKIVPKIRMEIKQTQSNLFLGVTVTIDKHQPTPTPFELSVDMAGTFAITSAADINTLREEAVAIMFPYVRSTISAITVTANMPAYFIPVLPSVNLAPSDEERKPGSVIIRPLEEDI